MPPLPSRKTLESMKRVDLQKLCKDYGVKANLKSEALIDLLLDTQTTVAPRHQRSTSKPPSSRRPVSARQASRAATNRTTSVVIHDTDDDDGEPDNFIRRRTDEPTEYEPGHPDLAITGLSQSQSTTATVPSIIRTRKAKELQRRLGVGKPVAAGGPGPRVATRPTTSSKGKQLKFSRSSKMEATIPEEGIASDPPLESVQARGIDAQTVPKAKMSGSLATLADIDELVASALRPLHDQLQVLRVELEQMHLVKAELAQLKHEVEGLKSDTLPNNNPSNPVTPKSQLSPRRPGPGGLVVPSPARAPEVQEFSPQLSSLASEAALNRHTLGKRARDSLGPCMEEDGLGDQGRFTGELGDLRIPKKPKISRYDDMTVDMVDDSDFVETGPTMQLLPSRAAMFNIFQEPNDLPGVLNGAVDTSHLSDYLITDSSPSGTVPTLERVQNERTGHGTTSQNVFALPSILVASTPAQQIYPRQTLYNMPAFTYPEPPQSPTPSGSGAGRNAENEQGSNNEKRSDMFQLLGLPPFARPEARIPSTIDPTALIAREDMDLPMTSNEVAMSLGLHTISSSSSITPMQLEVDDAPLKRVTMYGTELDGDTRFGDFGVEGVATGFWSGGAFPALNDQDVIFVMKVAICSTVRTSSTLWKKPIYNIARANQTNHRSVIALLLCMINRLVGRVLNNTDQSYPGPSTIVFITYINPADSSSPILTLCSPPAGPRVRSLSWSISAFIHSSLLQAMFRFIHILALGVIALPFVAAAVYDIQVGPNSELAFSPETITAQPGDQVVFHFNPKNHTVTQSSFANPCSQKPGGFDSGFEPVMTNQAQPTFAVTVKDTQPIWVYCQQTGHCGKGMVFAVNCGPDGSADSFANFKNAALALGAAAAASSTAGYTGTSPTATTAGITPSATGSPQVHKVIVGGSSNVYTPSSISAQPNDIVMFEFHQKNHTVTRSSFASPCSPLNADGTTGFDSGFFPVSASATQFPTWNYTVQDTQPVWAYCRQVGHCQSGMVFAINANENSAQNFAAFLNNAKSSGSGTASASTPSSTQSSAAVLNRLGGTSATLIMIALLSLIL
ncbi:hypothetical protein APHAL10511_006275 [Amanita phalloides]|nr:hypothetical protein APHAL10511_006275 [Amanita phalloides]